jgi:hypothetical protein
MERQPEIRNSGRGANFVEYPFAPLRPSLWIVTRRRPKPPRNGTQFEWRYWECGEAKMVCSPLRRTSLQ